MSRDFHGGRTYSAEPQGGGPGLGFRIALGLAWLKSQLVQLFGLARAAEGSNADQDRHPILPANDAELDCELRLVSMFQVFDGPGNKATRFGRQRQTEAQDR